MWEGSVDLRQAIAGNHELDVVVDVLRDGQLVAGGIDVKSVAVDATLTTTDGRSARLVVDRGITDGGLLNPLSDVVVVRSGIVGIELVPLFTGRVDAHSGSSLGEVAVSCMSRRVELARARLEVPFAATPGNTFVGEIRRIVQDVDPTWAVETVGVPVAQDLNTQVPPGLVWEEDRGRAIDDMAAAIGVLWLPDRTGGVALLPSRFTTDAAHTPVVTFYDGEAGCIVKADDVRSRQEINNSVTVVVERTDNSPPIRVTARDTDASSPTYWGGQFGKQNTIVKINTPVSADDAQLLATRMLRASLALARSWRIEVPHNPLLDPGDVIGVWYHDEPTVQLVESVAYAGAADQATVLATRQLI